MSRIIFSAILSALLLNATMGVCDEEIALLETVNSPFPETISLEPNISSFTEPMPLPKPQKGTFTAVFLSSLYPGLGQYYLGDTKEAAQLFSAASLSVSAAVATHKNTSTFIPSIMTFQAIGSYSVFSAWRESKIYNGDSVLFMPRDRLSDLTAAPLRWSVIKKPEVWGGLGVLLGAAAGVSYLHHRAASMSKASMEISIHPMTALPVAINEETTFRGLLQTSLLQSYSPYTAIAVSSLCFGAAHIPNAYLLERANRKNYYAFSLPLITGAGAYMGYLSYKNRSLQEAVALHAWYDFILFALGAWSAKNSIGDEPRSYAHTFAF